LQKLFEDLSNDELFNEENENEIKTKIKCPKQFIKKETKR